MTGREFLNSVANRRVDFLATLLQLSAETGSDYCVIGASP
jgi:hypothetical protein